MPGTLFAAMEVPVPVQQKSKPWSTPPDATRSPTALATSAQSIGWPVSGPCGSTSTPLFCRYSVTASVTRVFSSLPIAIRTGQF